MTARARTYIHQGILVAIFFPLIWRMLPGARPISPLDTLWMVGGWALYSTAFGLPSALRRFRERPWRPLPRATEAEVGVLALWVVVLGALVLAGLMDAVGPMVDTLRLRTTIHPVPAFLLGMAAYLPLVLAFTVGRRRQRGRLEAARDFLLRMRRLLPRSPRGRGMMAGILLLNPFVEEFAFRGVLVLLLATFVGTVPAVLFGLLACLAAHLYQGPGGLPFHGAFYAVVLCILFSEGGMWGAFGFHFAGDIAPWARVPGELKTLRTLRAARAERRRGRDVPN